MSNVCIYGWAGWDICVDDPTESWYENWIEKRLVIKYDNEDAPHTKISVVLPLSIYDLENMIEILQKVKDELKGIK